MKTFSVSASLIAAAALVFSAGIASAQDRVGERKQRMMNAISQNAGPQNAKRPIFDRPRVERPRVVSPAPQFDRSRFDRPRFDRPRFEPRPSDVRPIPPPRYVGRPVPRRNWVGPAIGAGVGAGILLSRPPVYAAPPPAYYPPAPAYAPPGGEVTDEDIAACMAQYRSYDPETLTFLGYDGLRHYCPSWLED